MLTTDESQGGGGAPQGAGRGTERKGPAQDRQVVLKNREATQTGEGNLK